MVLTLELSCRELGWRNARPVPLGVGLPVLDPLRVVGETERDEALSRARR
jgi:hypothetical protein